MVLYCAYGMLQLDLFSYIYLVKPYVKISLIVYNIQL